MHTQKLCSLSKMSIEKFTGLFAKTFGMHSGSSVFRQSFSKSKIEESIEPQLNARTARIYFVSIQVDFADSRTLRGLRSSLISL